MTESVLQAAGTMMVYRTPEIRKLNSYRTDPGR